MALQNLIPHEQDLETASPLYSNFIGTCKVTDIVDIDDDNFIQIKYLDTDHMLISGGNWVFFNLSQ